MSLTKERLQIEFEISNLKKERTGEELKVDLSIISMREETSSLLKIEEMDIGKIETAFNILKESVRLIAEINARIKKLERMM